ncbi:MAG: bifunctional (p)ppGpp synthetase/guanosine-3',5'-bis(diphosphate) 3'-pyrophosphohydrolase [Candidatus Pacebacteria bacterium]|nr:bifunctional (p)ppGpp synthetase/guanosine-3',5'-bis(diphosphate) 3'-pyrophosphohydrolase [Candidatus Paceibacterota bacterium]
MKTVKDIISFIDSPSKEDMKLLEKAFNFAVTAHSGQKRYSGEPYFNHVYETGKILAQLGMGATVISAGLLHDVVEDGITTKEELQEEFGDDIALLVEGVTKLGKIRFQGLKRHTESLRKLFMASSEDIRVLIIKFADRIHNMRTLEFVPKEKQLRIATETLEIFAPLAYRLGIGVLNRQLEDLSFPYVYPKEYKRVAEIMREETKDSIISLKKIDRSIKKRLAREGITNIQSNSRIKGMYSLYRKLERKHWDIDKIYDIAALRIIVPTKNDCYKVLGIIHDFRRPMPGRIKDYIAFPKPNGYQSLHTTVFTRFGNVVEIQLRTAEMHKEAEYGIASHLSYKNDISYENTNDPKMWVKRLLSNINSLDSKNKKVENPNTAPAWIKNLAKHPEESDGQEFISELKKDFFEHRVFVFTPKGDVIDLPTDSSPVDFAFAIHSDVGNHMHGAKVHGKLVSLDTKLKNGDIVDIMTKKTITPTKKWLDIAKTAEARRHIKSTLRKLQEANK